MQDALVVIVVGFVLSWTAYVGIRTLRRDRRGLALLFALREGDTALFVTYPTGLRYQLTQINGERGSWRHYVLEVTRDALLIHDLNPDLDWRFSLTPAELRWFGRPKKYTRGINEIWLHAEIDAVWWMIKLRLTRSAMQSLVRVLKDIATPEQVAAYRRHRPFVHVGPLSARPATQDMLGQWTLDAPVTVYLMPLFLVVLHGAAVQRVMPLEQVQNVSAIKRVDRPRAAGLVRFEIGEETVAFALPQHATFADALAEAARRTLEDPVQWQRKKKKGSGEDARYTLLDDDDDADAWDEDYFPSAPR
ncbi:MAG: hypothetical protein K8S97_03230 [Anaerolineae bacterium]|nr:hypothetical protein [Anaerolineae bacterium]